MKKLNLSKVASVLLVGSSSFLASAADYNADIVFTTLPEIQLTEVRAVDFGAVLSLTQADSCVMDADTGTEVLNKSTHVGADLTVNSGALSGDCTGNGTVGIYEVESFTSAPITVELTLGTGDGNIAFTPDGSVIDHNGAGPGDDAEDDIGGVGSPINVTASDAVTAFTQAGRNKVIIGGTVTNSQALTPNGTYSATFNLDVIYQ